MKTSDALFSSFSFLQQTWERIRRWIPATRLMRPATVLFIVFLWLDLKTPIFQTLIWTLYVGFEKIPLTDSWHGCQSRQSILLLLILCITWPMTIMRTSWRKPRNAMLSFSCTFPRTRTRSSCSRRSTRWRLSSPISKQSFSRRWIAMKLLECVPSSKRPKCLLSAIFRSIRLRVRSHSLNLSRERIWLNTWMIILVS